MSFSWVVFVDLTPPEKRPFAGSTSDNSMTTLALGWNGFQRLLTRNNYRNAAAVPPPPAAAQPQDNTSQSQDTFQGGNARRAETGTPGPFRLAEPANAAQVAWMLPLVLVAIGFFARNRRWRFPLSFEDQALFLWVGWFFICLIVLSFLRGLMHLYYWLMLAPPFAALTGIGVRSLWLAFRNGDGRWYEALFPLALLLTAVWQTYILLYSSSVGTSLIALIWLGIAISAFGFFRFRQPRKRLASARRAYPAAGAIESGRSKKPQGRCQPR